MPDAQKAKVFMNGRSQAVRIPAEYRFKSGEVYIRRDPQSGEIILSDPTPKRSLAEVFALIDVAGGADDLFTDRDTTPPQERDWL